jgi:serine/threonine protein kinase
LHWYRIESVLGQGGFGITYLAHDTNLDKQVAIKEYLPIELAMRENDSTVRPFTEERRD